MKQVRIQVTGKVQGVWFRVHTRDQAKALGLTGWVKNEPNGSVSIVACGPDSQIQLLIEWAHRGAPLSRVDQVIATDEQPESFDHFDIR